MMKGKAGLFLLMTAIIVASCGKTSYKKTPGGMPYKLYASKDTQKVMAGNIIKLTVTQKLNDSVLFTTDNGLPVYLMVGQQAPQPYDISELWTSLKMGDSLVATQMVDTFLKRAPDRLPPTFKKGDRIFTHLKIHGIFANDSLARLDEDKERKAFAANESKAIEKIIADKKITTVKTPSGAYLEVIKTGTGPVADTGNFVTVNYTGAFLNGEKFDSNVDSSFGHPGAYSYNAGVGEMIKGFDEAVLMMQKGAKIRVYVPSSLGYGSSGKPPKIKPNEHLMFDIELVDIKDKMPQQPMNNMPQIQVPPNN
jgi:FKBP-type peptidyl-prolyl cis-trans isomerase